MNREQTLAILYEMALTMSAETHASQLIQKMLQKLLYHTSFTCGVYLTEVTPSEGSVTQLEILEVNCGRRSRALKGSCLFIQPSRIFSSARLEHIDNLQSELRFSEEYTYYLSLPVSDNEGFLLFTNTYPETVLPLTQLFDPVLKNFYKVLSMCRENEKYTLMLEKNEKQLKEAQHIAHMGHWSWETKTGKLDWSDEIYRIFGFQPGEIVPDYETFYSMVHPDDVEMLKHSEQQAFTRDAPHSIDHRIVKRDGTVRWVHEEAITIRDADNQPLYLSGTVQDVTYRKNIEHRVVAQNNILSAISVRKPLQDIFRDIIEFVENQIDGALGSLLLLDEQGKHLMHGCAPSLPETYCSAIDGLLIGEDVGSCGTAAYTGRLTVVSDIAQHPYWKNYRELAKKAGLAACWSQPVLNADKSVIGTFAIYFHTPRVPVAAELSLIETAADLASIAITRESYEHNLTMAKNDAIKASKAKSEFLSNMSHELRTPLNAILGFAQLLDMVQEPALTAEQKDSVAEISKAGHHLLALINEVLDLARIESGKTELSIGQVYVRELIDECSKLVNNMAQAREIELIFDDIGNYIVLADYMRAKQAVINLLSNAIKYNHRHGKVRIACEVVEPGMLRINVTDTGIGIPEAQQGRLFHAFERLGQEASFIEGTGIGLVICRKLIMMMDGDIGFTSKEGEGSRFWIDLPLSIEHDLKKIEPGGRKLAVVKKIKKLKIIYIEDNPSNLKLVQQLLNKFSNIELICCDNPLIGLDLVVANMPALILLDINMPEMNGYQVLSELKQNVKTQKIPVIAVTSNAMPTDIQRGLEAGFDYYFTKPFDAQQFIDTINGFLSQSRKKFA